MSSILGETTKKERIAYSLLGFSQTLLSQIVAFYLLYFYTDILTIPAKTITVLFMMSHIWDAVNDQIFGFSMCKTKSKHGQMRPYLLWTALPMGILTIAMFFSPNLSLVYKIIYAYIIYFVWDIAKTFLSIASNSLLPLISKDINERTKINSYFIIAAVLGVLIVSSFTLPLSNWFGGGNWAMTSVGNKQTGFLLTVVLFALIAIPLQLFAFKNIKERHVIHAESAVTLKTAIKCLISDKKLLLYLVIFIFTSMANTFKNQSAAYYFSYVIGKPNMTSVFFFAGISASLLMQLSLQKVVRMLSASRSIVAGMVGSLCGLLIMLLAQKNFAVLMIGNIIFGLASAIPANLVYVILAEFIDKCNEKYKQNLNSWLYATFNFGTKIGVGFGGAICGAVLTYVKYKPNQIATHLVEKGLTFNFLGGTIIFYAISSVLMVVLVCTKSNTPKAL